LLAYVAQHSDTAHAACDQKAMVHLLQWWQQHGFHQALIVRPDMRLIQGDAV
jgi:hypothetical protein